MRTTLTIDDDIAVQLERLRRSGKGSLKQIVNDLLRAGLNNAQAQPQRRKTHRTKVVQLGRCLVGNVDDVAEALSLAEGEDFR
tara:strand:+ start:1381 stop:1629 length:249 start_codon:yes stop_codon:yes gene_type:complete